MVRAARNQWQSGASASVAQVVYSQAAVADLERAFEFIAENDPRVALVAADAICEAIEALANHPLIGRVVEGGLRELVISYGKTGYVALYRFLPAQDQVRVLAIRHQRELDYPG